MNQNKDFIVLSVVPPNPQLGNLLEVKRVVPIQLTTDTWGDIDYLPLTAKALDNDAEANLGSDGYLEGRGNGHHVEAQSRNTYGYGNYHNGRETNGNGEL